MTNQDIDTSTITASPAVISLIENAAVSFEIDRVAARDYLFRAYALIRAQKMRRRESACASRGLLAWQTRRACDFIEAHLDSPMKAKDIAAEVHLSLSQFFRSFKLTVGLTPSQYIARRRIEAAQRLMLLTQDSLSDIAIQCGLCDHSHLCNVFRRFVGLSPTAWRRLQAAAGS
jgi:AraC family transcriptional regulator